MRAYRRKVPAFMRGVYKVGQKEQIVLLLKSNCPMTQSELAEAIYGDNLHTPNIYNALKSLKESGEIICSGERPARFFLPKALSVEAERL